MYVERAQLELPKILIGVFFPGNVLCGFAHVGVLRLFSPASEGRILLNLLCFYFNWLLKQTFYTRAHKRGARNWTNIEKCSSHRVCVYSEHIILGSHSATCAPRAVYNCVCPLAGSIKIAWCIYVHESSSPFWRSMLPFAISNLQRRWQRDVEILMMNAIKTERQIHLNYHQQYFCIADFFREAYYNC
jgi:hypothetical protein